MPGSDHDMQFDNPIGLAHTIINDLLLPMGLLSGPLPIEVSSKSIKNGDSISFSMESKVNPMPNQPTETLATIADVTTAHLDKKYESEMINV